MVFKADTLFAGKRVGFLVLRQRVRPATKGSYITRKKWLCDCICGKRITVPEQYLVREPNPKSHCGCKTGTFESTHKLEYRVWHMMHVRCENPKHIAYKHYGARGIKVCDRWQKTNPNGFQNFVSDMGPRISIKYTIDRIDPDGIYEPFKPDGVTRQTRWATWSEQNNNKRMHKIYA